MGLEYRLLGPLEALAEGRPLRIGGSRPRAVLAVLLLHAGHVVPSTRLIDEVWGDNPPDTASNVLQGYVSQLRKQLGRAAIERASRAYLLRVEREALDLDRFERLATEGASALTAGQPEQASHLLADALRLWRGPALADVVEDGILRAEAARLEELRLVALERRIEADLACGRHADVVGELQTLAADWPLRERPCALLMLALYRGGRQADALAAYRAARATLVDELGIEPGATLQELERAVLRQDPALAAPSGPVPPRAEPAQRTILAAALEPDALDLLLALAAPLAQLSPPRELVVAATVADAGALTATASISERAPRSAARPRCRDARSGVHAR